MGLGISTIYFVDKSLLLNKLRTPTNHHFFSHWVVNWSQWVDELVKLERVKNFYFRFEKVNSVDVILLVKKKQPEGCFFIFNDLLKRRV